MTGMELSRRYFKDAAQPRLKRDFPELYPRLAAGLVGNGSECFGYDDDLSRDHDWGADFYIWTSQDDREYIPALSEWKQNLLTECPPEHKRQQSEYGAQIGVMTCGDFYKALVGFPSGPEAIHDWLRVPEENLSLAVNGEVFFDQSGEFTKTRKYLLCHYPDDIRLKRMSACCMALAQTGQYNHARTARRGDAVTMRAVLSRFSDNAIALVFLLNKVYKPYYKWAFRALTGLPVLGTESSELLKALAETGGIDDQSIIIQERYIQRLCDLFVRELRLQGLSTSDDYFLASHAEEIRSAIQDAFLRSLPAQYQI